MPFDPQKDRIDKLQEGLYSRGAPAITAQERPTLTPHDREFAEASTTRFKTDEEFADELRGSSQDHNPRRTSFFNKLFLASVVFFVIAAGIAGAIFYSGLNVISSKNVDITVSGLVAVPAGEQLALDVTVQNNNNVALEEGQLTIEYPEGTRSPTSITTTLTRDTLPLETIPAGKSTTRTIKAVLFGEKDSLKQIKISVDYKPHGSNAHFTKEKSIDISISSSPVLVTVDMPKEINTAQEFNITVGVASNSEAPVRDLLVRADFPFGFTPTDATPKASYDNNVWIIGDLRPKEKRTIVLKGKIEAQDEEERTFRFTTGVASAQDEKQVGVAFIASQQSVVIKKPFIALKLNFDYSDGKDVVVPAGTRLQGTVDWANNLPVDIADATIQLKLTGASLSRDQVTANDGGFYRSVDNTIVWDKNTLSSLRDLAPGQSGTVGFSLATISATQALALQGKNMEIVADLKMTGTKISSDGPSQPVSASVSQRLKIATNLNVNARSLYSIGPFKNSGPVPVHADQKTTYTVAWTLSNTFNDVGGATVSAKLPPSVSWLGVVSPLGEKVSYDEANRIVTWQAGEIKAGVGQNTSPRETFFQLAVQPSVNQIGTVPNLLEDIRVTGVDRFTTKNINANVSPVTTRMSTDPTYNFGDEQVVK